MQGTLFLLEVRMTWTTPQFEVVEVTMEVTAYVARR
jgi:coenzyme PQQ precursor peptide PqqA